MKELRTFKAGSAVSDLVTFLEGSLCELLGDSAPTISAKVRVTVELVKADDLVIDRVLNELSLVTAKAHVEKFLDYRRDRKRNAVNSVDALKNLLIPFKERPGLLREVIDKAISRGWIGIEPSMCEGSQATVSRDYQPTKGGPSGGTW